MAVWLPSTGKLYLPPQKPTPRVLSTDEYVRRTNIYFHATSERLFTVGHPYFPIIGDDNTVKVPKVSGSQYRVWRVHLPDPNKFALIDKDVYDPDSERLVWAVRGMEISRGGPLGVGVAGHPLFNKFADTENPFSYNDEVKTENRLNVSSEPKQTQLFMIGCAPPVGGHWDAAVPCTAQPLNKGDCPALEYINSTIEDGDMCDTGFGNVNFKTLSADKATAPLDVINTISKWPDLIQMTKDVYGDHIFFYGTREQLYTRHMGNRAGTGDPLPEHNTYYLPPGEGPQKDNFAGTTYFTTVSGSLVSSEGQLFNRPYWLQRAQGPNNGICWGNQCFVTLVDNTRNTNFTISVYNGEESFPSDTYTYKAKDFKQYLRHTEEYNLEFIFQLCKVPLTADILAHLNVMNPSILEGWQLAFMPPAPSGLESTYRFINSLATKCPTTEEDKENDDPYKNLNFWDIDLTDKFSSELSQVPLGRRFLYQMGMLNGKRSVRTTTVTKRKTKKRKLNP